MSAWPLTLKWLWKQRHVDKRIRHVSENVNIGTVQVKGIWEFFILSQTFPQAWNCIKLKSLKKKERIFLALNRNTTHLSTSASVLDRAFDASAVTLWPHCAPALVTPAPPFPAQPTDGSQTSSRRLLSWHHLPVGLTSAPLGACCLFPELLLKTTTSVGRVLAVRYCNLHIDLLDLISVIRMRKQTQREEIRAQTWQCVCPAVPVSHLPFSPSSHSLVHLYCFPCSSSWGVGPSFCSLHWWILTVWLNACLVTGTH